MELELILHFILQYAGVLFWEIGKSLLLWVPLGIVLAIIFYFFCTRKGWLDIRGQKKTWTRVIYALILFFVCSPLIAFAGVLTGVRNGILEIVILEANKYQLNRPCGAVLLIPITMGHVAQESKGDITDLEVLFQKANAADTSFLLDKTKRDQAMNRVTLAFLDVAIQHLNDNIERLKLEKELKEWKAEKWFRPLAEWIVTNSVNKKMRAYQELFDNLVADADGKLSFNSASGQVGDNLFRKVCSKILGTIFNGMRMQMLLIAALVWGACIGILQLIGRWLTRDQAATSDSATAS